MRIWKSHPLFSLVNGYLVNSPQPSDMSYLWNFGLLLGFWYLMLRLVLHIYNYITAGLIINLFL